MKRKIVGILIIMLFISGATFPITLSTNKINSSLKGEVIDQYQDWSDDCIYISGIQWQEFIPTMIKHVRIEVNIAQWYGGSPDLKLSIEKPLGSILTFKELPATSIPSGTCDWVSFDIPDIELTPGLNYYIVLNAPLGSEYGWGFSHNGLYIPGDSSISPSDWCFRTYCLENNPPNNPTINGYASGKAGNPYTYDFTTTDPDGDDVSYFIKWGDGSITSWTTFQTSGSSYTETHTWTVKDAYTIEVKAKDIHGAESGWSTLPISMPKVKTTETKTNNEINSMMFCDVLIKGTATVQVIRGSFIIGFGKCLYMKVDLENDGSLEISSITNPSNSVGLKGSHQIHLIGFNGYYGHLIKTRIDGKALIAIWG